MQWIACTTAILSFIFAAITLYLFFFKKHTCLLLWFAGLLFYGIASGAEFMMLGGNMNLLVYRLWYLNGAVYSAAFLAMGTLYYFAPRRVAFPALLLLTIASIYACIIIFIAPVDISGMHGLSSRPLPLQIRILSPFFNILAVLVLLAGAVHGIYTLMKRKRGLLSALCLMLAGAGAVLPSISGILMRMGEKASVYTAGMELLGLIVFFVSIILGFAIKTMLGPGSRVDARNVAE